MDLTPRKVKDVVAELRKDIDPERKTVAVMDLNIGGRVKDWANAKADRGPAARPGSSLTPCTMQSEQPMQTAPGASFGSASLSTAPVGTNPGDILDEELCESLIHA